MTHVYRLVLSAFLASLMFGRVEAQAEPKITYLQDLTKFASYGSLLMHEDRVWTGVALYSSSDPAGMHVVLVHDAKTNAPSKTIRVPHAPQFLYAFGPNKVLAVGMSAKAVGGGTVWKTHFSVISINGENFDVKTHDFPNGRSVVEGKDSPNDFPNEIFVKQFAGTPDDMYFSLQAGENDVMRFNGNGRSRKLNHRIIMPNQMIMSGKDLLVMERDNIDNIFRIDLNTNQSTRFFEKGTPLWFDEMMLIADGKTLALAEEQRVMLVNAKNGNVDREITFENPTAMAMYGACLVVGGYDSRIVEFYNLDSDTKEPVESWDLSVLGGKFEKIVALVVDEPTGRVFVRATRACPYCGHSPNSLVVVEDDGKDLAKACAK